MSTLPVLRADYVRIILMEAHACPSTMDIKGLEDLMKSCIATDIPALEAFTNDARYHVKSAAAFILRKHRFAEAKALASETQATQTKEQ